MVVVYDEGMGVAQAPVTMPVAVGRGQGRVRMVRVLLCGMHVFDFIMLVKKLARVVPRP